jgi:hypothetical protein
MEPTKQTLRWPLVLATFFLYIFQSAPYSFFEILYPVLYGLEGFSEDDLTQLRYSGLPWCLKFVFGIIFQRFWQPPRWLIAVLQLVMGALMIGMTWIPLGNVTLTMVFFFVINVLCVAHDTSFDGQMIALFTGRGILLQMTQMMGYLIFDVIISFVGISFYTPYLFLIVGILSMLAAPLLWVYDWAELPRAEFAGMWGDFVKTLPTSVITLLYYFVTTWGDSTLGYFGADISPDEEELGVIFGLYMIGVFFGLSYGQYMFIEWTYVGILAALVIEAASVLFYWFLAEGTAYSAKCTLFFFGGFFTSGSDAVIQTLLIDASTEVNTDTLMYSSPWQRRL